ncbi:MAG: hypothetical protein AAF387_13410 [Pseudomonadota bacterium]
MDWNFAALVAQIVSALAVVISVLYLAQQIRAQTRESRLNATRDLAKDFRDLLADIGRDDQLFKLFRRSLNDYDSLNDEERSRIHMCFYNRIFGLQEQLYLHLRHKNIDMVFLTSMQNRFSEIVQSGGFKSWWRRNGNVYTEDFQYYVQKLISVKKTTVSETNEKSI